MFTRVRKLFTSAGKAVAPQVEEVEEEEYDYNTDLPWTGRRKLPGFGPPEEGGGLTDRLPVELVVRILDGVRNPRRETYGSDRLMWVVCRSVCRTWNVLVRDLHRRGLVELDHKKQKEEEDREELKRLRSIFIPPSPVVALPGPRVGNSPSAWRHEDDDVPKPGAGAKAATRRDYNHKAPSSFLADVAGQGWLPVLEWAYANGCRAQYYDKKRLCERAAEGGHLEVLRWALDKRELEFSAVRWIPQFLISGHPVA